MNLWEFIGPCIIARLFDKDCSLYAPLNLLQPPNLSDTFRLP